MRIRLAGVEDLRSIMALEEEAFGSERFSKDLVLHLLTDPEVVTMMTEDDDAVAYAMMRVIVPYETADVLSVAVSPRRRREGLGRELMTKMESIASDGGVVTMVLYVRPDNVAAVNLYISLGYKALARCRGYYPDGSDANMMVKHLED